MVFSIGFNYSKKEGVLYMIRFTALSIHIVMVHLIRNIVLWMSWYKNRHHMGVKDQDTRHIGIDKESRARATYIY